VGRRGAEEPEESVAHKGDDSSAGAPIPVGVSHRVDRRLAHRQFVSSSNPAPLWGVSLRVSVTDQSLNFGVACVVWCGNARWPQTVARPLLLRELINTIGRGTPASPGDAGWLMGAMVAILIVEGW
jgi:hypothetical protein